MPRHTIVDGYNVIRKHPTLANLERQSMELARDALVARLNNDPSLRNDQVTVVFDGAKGGQGRQQTTQRGRVRVVFSRLGESADEVIKRLVEASPAPVRVVTNDRDLRAHASAQGGTPVSVKPRLPSPPRRDEDNLDAPRPSKKGPSHRPKKRSRTSDPYWSP